MRKKRRVVVPVTQAEVGAWLTALSLDSRKTCADLVEAGLIRKQRWYNWVRGRNLFQAASLLTIIEVLRPGSLQDIGLRGSDK